MENFYAEFAKAYPQNNLVITVQKIGGGEVEVAYENASWRYIALFIEGTSVYTVAKGSQTFYGLHGHEEVADKLNRYYEDGEM